MTLRILGTDKEKDELITDMYEALKGLMRDYSTNPNSDIFYAACLKAREALTKAEGKGE
jgi:hypothetical protein